MGKGMLWIASSKAYDDKDKISEFASGHKQHMGKWMLWIATLKAHAELSSQMLLCQQSDSNFVWMIFVLVVAMVMVNPFLVTR